MPSAAPRLIVPALGVTQIFAWGSSYYLPAVLAQPIASDTGWSLTWIVGGLSLGLLIAGLTAPFVGRQIHRRGGRPVLAASAVLLGLGCLGLAIAPTLPMFVGAWVLMGLGMSAGLYDAAFSTLGRLYGQDARQSITTVTLFGGLASTICWPLSAFFLQSLGWRGTCLAYAAIQLFICLGIYLAALPREPRHDPVDPPRDGVTVPSPRHARAILLLLTLVITVASAISTIISVHLLAILQAREISLGDAVALGAMIGPAQVAARFIEMLIGKYHHPIWTKLASAVFVALGVALLGGDLPLISLGVIVYGAGIGLESIARATLPLTLFGAQDYAPIMGRLARPSLIAQAATPSIGAFLILWVGPDRTLGIVGALAAVNMLLAASLFLVHRRSRRR
ncbi:MAG: MFS transporter [Dongiaceae bacterium]